MEVMVRNQKWLIPCWMNSLPKNRMKERKTHKAQIMVNSKMNRMKKEKETDNCSLN